MKVGDIILLKNDENVPADLVIMASSLATGLAYVQTSSLDGEKALKTKTQ